MLAKRIIPCLDVKEGQVVKGVQFKNHRIIGDALELAKKYQKQEADELVFYDITASSENRTVDNNWIIKIAENINIPFCVAGGIKTVEQAEVILNSGADKISINSFALEKPNLITELAERFGSQCVVVGIDSRFEDGEYWVYQYTGSEKTIKSAKKRTKDWIKEAMDLGAGEIVLNCMNQDGVKKGYDIEQLNIMSDIINIPLIASGGAGSIEDFETVFKETNVSGALAASIFHDNKTEIPILKQFLKTKGITVRI